VPILKEGLDTMVKKLVLGTEVYERQ